MSEKEIRVDVERVWKEAGRANYARATREARGLHCDPDEYPSAGDILYAARKRWQNEALEEAALALADHGAENDIINGVVGSCIRRIRALKKE